MSLRSIYSVRRPHSSLSVFFLLAKFLFLNESKFDSKRNARHFLLFWGGGGRGTSRGKFLNKLILLFRFASRIAKNSFLFRNGETRTRRWFGGYKGRVPLFYRGMGLGGTSMAAKYSVCHKRRTQSKKFESGSLASEEEEKSLRICI